MAQLRAATQLKGTLESILIFGSQALSLDVAALQSIYSSVIRLKHGKWLLNSLTDCPQHWESFVSQFPEYQTSSSVSMPHQLVEWSKTGTISQTSTHLPNILVMPLVVICHLAEYEKLLEETLTDDNVAELFPAHSTKVLGFCTGLLSAMAVSLSANRHQLETYGSTVIRLATIIGGIVDGQDASDINGPAKSMTVAWTSPEGAEELNRTVARHPESYKSVIFDERRATITTAAKTAASLQQELRDASISVQEIGLHGRFHSRGYTEDIERFLQYFQSKPMVLCLPDASALLCPMTSNSGKGDYITTGSLHAHALCTILLEYCDWYGTVKYLLSSRSGGHKPVVRTFGLERCIPPTLAKELGQATSQPEDRSGNPPGSIRQDDIAVVGMSIKVAGADDVVEFWDLLCEGSSQHQEVPDRISFDTVWRESEHGRKWFGNFVNDPDAFDQKFFKKSAREAATMDPQQRQMMQVAYQALQQAGYLNKPEDVREKNFTCYIGVCSADYENNIACYQPNAFSATGNLKSFIAGKISHFFGWTGSAMCIDTACSSSLVAVHLACKSILSGECDASLAGGVNIIVNPLWFQNLAGASFLSPTGQCKPFDSSADGYCRGEGIAAVVLKKMSKALADGDQILGVIPSTAVYQNENCTPIFVPNAPSLSSLFRRVLDDSGLKPNQIGYVEAHGTGTQVGDPAEYDSIRQVFGESTKRQQSLLLGSVKGLVGHTECTSGAVSLIKTLLMVQHGAVPAQQSFKEPNPSLNMVAEDRIEIVTKARKWDTSFRAALINNYGASGSNASMIVTQAPSRATETATRRVSTPIDFPFRIFGRDLRALKEYSGKLRQYLLQPKAGQDMSIANVAFNVCHQSNTSLENAWNISCRSMDHLLDSLKALEAGDINAGQLVQPQPRPVILCFGGQISTHVGLSREVYDSVAVLRFWLEQCDQVFHSLGYETIFPGIFEKEPIEDPVKLQTLLFAMQYSCAKAWIDCGIQPVAVVGHSFGELVSLCIAGVLSLKDAITMIAERAKVIREYWGPEKGAMVAVEADISQAEALLIEVAAVCRDVGEVPPTIACFNGPRSFTVAGSAKAIDMTMHTMTQNKYMGIRHKRLNVTNAFHSTLVEPLMDKLEDIGRRLTFNKPLLDLERATEFKSSDSFYPRYVADHMRNPVYFNNAVQRLAQKYPCAVWLEAGSNSTITNMAARATGSPKSQVFQALSISNDNGLNFLASATMNLWGAGLGHLSFWPHHRRQTHEYSPLLLPPYQFEKTRHWMEAKPPPVHTLHLKESTPESPMTLWSLDRYLDDERRSAQFKINTESQVYTSLVSGHLIAQTTPICPATVQVGIVIEAILTLRPDSDSGSLRPKIFNVDNKAPICFDPSRRVWLEAHFTAGNNTANLSWEWRIMSQADGNSTTITHVTGGMEFASGGENSEGKLEFARYERLVGHQRCLALLQSDDAEDIIQGRHIYKAFSEVVDYSEQYHGVGKLVGKGSESAGRVLKKYQGDAWLDPLLGDCFSQVGGIWVNCMANKNQGDMYIATGFEKWLRSPDISDDEYSRVEKWDVLATHHAESPELWLTDIFVFDASTGRMIEAILGIKYHGVSKASMRKILMRLAASEPPPQEANAAVGERGMQPKVSMDTQAAEAPKISKQRTKNASRGNEIQEKTRALLAEISGLEPEAIGPNAQLVEIGIDSLIGMELARDIEGLFKCVLHSEELMNIATFDDLVRLVHTALGVPVEDASDSSLADSVDEEDVDNSLSSNSSDSESTDVSSVTGASTMKVIAMNTTRAGHSNTDVLPGATSTDLKLSQSLIIEAFEESKRLTDQFITDYRCAGYMDEVLPRQTQLGISLIIEAFEQLSCPLRTAKQGQRLERIRHEPDQRLLANYLYETLEKVGRIIDIDDGMVVRTAVSLTAYKSSDELLRNLLREFPDHEWANKLTFFAGSRLADVLTGKCDGIKLIFGSDEGRELVTGLYGDSLLNKLANVQMQDILIRLISKMPKDQGPLRIMELGAGTGGTTKGMVDLLARLNVPVEYTFTDLSGSFVAGARRMFKNYPFMKFRVHNIEHPPADDLVGTQHLIIASNAIHATHNLVKSLGNIRKALRPDDGVLMMLEMTQPVLWVDLIFGLFEGWWLFDDDRKHAIAHQTVWQRDLQRAGYGHVDWTDGHLPEIEIQRVLVAFASGPQYERQDLPARQAPEQSAGLSPAARKATIDGYLSKYSHGFTAPATVPSSPLPPIQNGQGQTVMITGATGSLGVQLVAHLASLPQVSRIICLNRKSTHIPEARQRRAMEERGILLVAACQAKLHILQTDTSKPLLGLPEPEYESLTRSVTHIIHNAWPMSGKRPLAAMESQFSVMRNLVEFAREAAGTRPAPFRVGFQFISSIAVVGHYRLKAGERVVPEERVEIRDVLPNGYGEAKFICERILDETLHKYPERFRTMSVRLGQIAGSRISGYWNPMEHLSFLIKSSQTLRALPKFEGDLCWTPVEEVAGTLADLILSSENHNDNIEPYPIYHIDNPIRQPWSDVIPILAEALNVLPGGVIPFDEWVRRVRSFPGSADTDNPAAKLVDFLDDNFVRMSCGGLLLGTEKSCEHSSTLRSVGPVKAEVIQKYVQAWRDMGFLKA